MSYKIQNKECNTELEYDNQDTLSWTIMNTPIDLMKLLIFYCDLSTLISLIIILK